MQLPHAPGPSYTPHPFPAALTRGKGGGGEVRDRERGVPWSRALGEGVELPLRVTAAAERDKGEIRHVSVVFVSFGGEVW